MKNDSAQFLIQRGRQSIPCCLAVTLLLLVLTVTPVLAQGLDEHFAIDRFQVEGNTQFAPDEITAVLTPFTGAKQVYGDVQRAIDALMRLYRSKGFGLVWVVAPEQGLDGGVVVLWVYEARVGSVTITGNRFFDDANIRASLPALRDDRVFIVGDISANVQLANENPAKQVDIALHPGKIKGAVDATVDVLDVPPFKLFATLDTTGNQQTGDFRLGVGAQHANLFNRDHVATFNYVTSPGKWDQVSLYSGSYRLPIYVAGDSIDLFLARSDVNAGSTQTVAGPLTFSGKGAVYGVRYNVLLPRLGDYAQRIVVGLDYRAYENNCELGTFGSVGCGSAGVDVTVMPLSLAYSGNWSKPGRISDISFALAHNIPGAAHGHEVDFNAARPSPTGDGGATANYLVLRIGASMVQAFASNWQLRAACTAQYSPDALVSGEQFGVTGATAVRGFLEREIVRDTGAVATLEIYSPNLTGRLIPGEGNLRALLSTDVAMAVNNTLAGESRQQTSVASIGAGLRWNIQRNFNVRFDVARVMDAGGTRNVGDFRGHLSIYVGM